MDSGIHVFEQDFDRFMRVDEALSLVVHDMRAALTAIKGFARTLDRRVGGLSSEQRLTALRTIICRTNELLVFAEDVLDVARAGHSRLALQLEQAGLGSPAAQVIQMQARERRGTRSR